MPAHRSRIFAPWTSILKSLARSIGVKNAPERALSCSAPSCQFS